MSSYRCSAARPRGRSRRAQQSGEVRRTGFLRVGPPPPAFIDRFRQGLYRLGLIEGRHFIIEYALGPERANARAVLDFAREFFATGGQSARLITPCKNRPAI